MGENQQASNHNVIDMDTIKRIITATIVVCGAVYILYRNRTALKKFIPKKVDSGDSLLTDVGVAFLQYADVFQGIYEPMYKASNGSISMERIFNVLTEWDIRMNNINDIPSTLKGWWLTIVKDMDNLDKDMLIDRAKEIMKMICSSGITRDRRSDIIADNTTYTYYDSLDETRFYNGQRLRVETPCWFINSNPVRIIEKGICETL